MNTYNPNDYPHNWLLLAAYKPTYTSKDQAVQDFVLGKDFRLYQGPYCSIRNWNEQPLYVLCVNEFVNITEDVRKAL